MAEVYKPVNGSTQLPAALTEAGNLKIVIVEVNPDLTEP